MDLRKLIKFGNSSYVVTLPFEWVKKHELDKGEKVSVRETESSIIISLQRDKEGRVATTDAEDKPLKLLNKEIISYYLKNYETICITGENIIEKLEEIKSIREKLSSLEITEIHPNKIVLKDLAGVKDLEVTKIINEVIEMEKMMFDELGKEENKQHFISSLDSNINKLAFLGYKAVNYNLDNLSNPDQVKDCIHYWRIVHSLEDMGDKVKRIARYLKDKDDNPVYTAINQVIREIKEYFIFITSLLDQKVQLDTNMKLYLDKKQSLLIEFERLRVDLKDDLTLYLVLTQIFKDVLGDIDTIVLSIVDLRY